MKKPFSLFLLLLTVLIAGCSKAPGKTEAKLKLTLSGIANFSTGIGSGGAILFGKSAKGESFGKKIMNAEENLDLPNGSWTFYALMWGSDGTTMNGKVHCGKSVNLLNGVDTTISLSLNNAKCADPEFSGGRHYVGVGGNIRFADLYIEECDEINAATGNRCGLDNQGSALSYRLVFNNFKKGPVGPAIFDPANSLVSGCQLVDNSMNPNNMFAQGLPANFPSGDGMSPFVVGAELFLGSTTCSTPDPKGVHYISFNQGLGMPNPDMDKVVTSTSSCTYSTPDFTGSADFVKNKCESLFGVMNAGSCNYSPVPSIMSRFPEAGDCATQVAAVPGIKHLVSIPKPVLCGRYINQSAVIGTHPFAGGDGSFMRPFKICTEWQINQIGEMGADPSYSNKIYKLMNDLDMNKADMGPYARPTCTNVGGVVRDHHNLNPIDPLFSTCAVAYSVGNGFQGIFNGNNKTIFNARISAENTLHVGFTRKMWGGSVVKNLNFKNLEVSGRSYVGGVSGYVESGKAEILNVSINKADIEARETGGLEGGNVGAIAGYLGGVNPNQSRIINAQVALADVRGRVIVGGLVGENSGIIERSKFHGTVESKYTGAVDQIGGITSINNSDGKILNSFSEGVASSWSRETGGIAGRNNGEIREVYSNMFLSLKHSNSGDNIYAGGIIGKNDLNGSLADCYSDNKYKYVSGGASTLNYGGVIGYDGASTAVVAGNCYTASLNTPGIFHGLMHSQMRDGSIPAGITVTSPSNWIRPIGTPPRLAWEMRECMLLQNRDTVVNQANMGRGSILNPIVICSPDQLGQISNRPAAEHYVISEDLNMTSWATNIENFYGTLDGREAMIYGVSLNYAPSLVENVGLIKNNFGKITRLNLVGNSINSTDTTKTAVGLLTGENQGVITKISFLDNTLYASTNVGLVAGKNSTLGGIINQIEIDDNTITGTDKVGGAVGLNAVGASVSRVSSRVELKNIISPSSFHSFGGVVGENRSSVDQAEFNGKITFSMSTSTPPVRTGGIVGFNSISVASVTNALFGKDAILSMKDYTKIGGIVGENAGSVRISLAVGKIVYDNSGGTVTDGSAMHPSIGDNPGSTTDVFYMKNKIGAYLGSNTLSCSGTAPNFTGTVSTTGLNYMDPASAPYNANMFTPQMNSGSGLVNWTPFSLSSIDNMNIVAPSCQSGPIYLYKSFLLYSTAGELEAADFEDVTNFSAFDVAYTDRITPANSTRQAELIEYHVAMMENRLPTLTPPIWEYESDEDHPKLLQVRK